MTAGTTASMRGSSSTPWRPERPGFATPTSRDRPIRAAGDRVVSSPSGSLPDEAPGERKETRHPDPHGHREEDRPLRRPALAEPAAAASGHPGEPRRDLLP